MENNVNMAFFQLPEYIKPLSHQLAGHFFGAKNDRLGLLKDEKTGFILKSLVSTRGERERMFYRDVFDCGDDEARNKLHTFLTKPHGVIMINNSPFLQLEDVCQDFVNPQNMDIKIGYRTYDPDATPERIKMCNSKYKWGEKLGFRISGLRVTNPQTKEKIYINKLAGLELDVSAVKDKLKLFFGMKFYDKQRCSQLLSHYLNRLRSIHEWFIKYNINLYLFFSSSLLFIHSYNPNEIKSTIKMIDFAHVFANEPTGDNEPLDLNYLYGLEKLTEIVQNLLNQCRNTKASIA